MGHAVSPKEWTLTNRIGFSNKIYNTFNPELYYNSRAPSSEFSLLPQQRIVKDYMQIDSPYRGILLYHELGSGKSAASIAASESYLKHNKIFVMTPASLATNYENEILKVSSLGSILKKEWKLIKVNTSKETKELLFNNYGISDKIIKKDNLIWIPNYINDIPGAVIVKETHDKDDKKIIDIIKSHIVKNKYHFISYNGLTQKLINDLGKSPFDNSFIVIDEVHNFISRVINGSKLSKSIYNHIINATNCKIVLLSGTPIINNPFEIATLINLIRGPLVVHNLSLLKNSSMPTMEGIRIKLEETKLIEYVDDINIDEDQRLIQISLLPKNYKKKDNIPIKIIKENWGSTIIKIIEDIITQINKIPSIKLSIRHTSVNFYSLPNDKKDFDSAFINDADPENPKITNTDLFMRRILGTISYYKISGTELFPDVLPLSMNIINMTNHQLNIYNGVRTIERNMEKTNKGGLFENKNSVYRAFSRMVCNFAFPEKIKRLYPNDIKKLLKKEIDVDEDDEEPEDDSTKKDELYETKLEEAINDLKKSDGLTLKGLEKETSPKFAKMYNDIIESPGSVLVYSQFRNVEGLGIFTEVLKKQGFIEIELKKQEGSYVFTNPDVFNPIYDNKRIVIFNQDREKTNILMNLFNGEFNLLPTSIREALPEDNNQLYGKLVKVFCITASGAEGISLKNVRRVLITEPYWNNVRISQVIGRAIRTYSHISLPKKDQNVQVFMYIMKLTDKQLSSDPTLRILDKSKTTDQHILEIATKKEDIINQFLNMLKASSFDCIINSNKNKPLEHGYKCYNWALGANPNELSYTDNYKDDYKIMQHTKIQIKRTGKGKVISKDGNKYVALNGKVYDYYSYINAGILIPAEI
jgi:superfamily II DNA or RNA helicase